MKLQRLDRKPDKWKPLAIIFTILAIASPAETYRVFTSDAPDIVANRSWLQVMAVVSTVIFISLALLFWKKSNRTKH